MTRIEHFNDPDAPTANRLVPAASAIVVDQAGRILLHRRVDSELWSIPGGGMEVGERIADTVVREVREETGLEVEPEAVERSTSLRVRRTERATTCSAP